MPKLLNGVSKDAVSIFSIYCEAQKQEPGYFDLSLVFSKRINYANIFSDKNDAELFYRRLKPIIYKLRDNIVFEKIDEPKIEIVFNESNDTVIIKSNIEFSSTNIDARCMQIMSTVAAEVTKLCMAYYSYSESKYPFTATKQYNDNGRYVDHKGENVPFFEKTAQVLYI